MPWQSAPPLIIIAGAFTLTGLGLRGIDNLAYGRVSTKEAAVRQSPTFIPILFYFSLAVYTTQY